MPNSFSLRRGVVTACGGLSLLFLAGCPGNTAVTITGKVVLPSNVKLIETDVVRVVFVPEEEGKKVASGKVNNADLSFESKDCVPGKYKVSVRIVPYAGAKDTQTRMQSFAPFNQAHDEKHTKVSVVVGPESRQTMTIDFVKDTVIK